MSNPSLIWAQLSMPNPSAGSIPFVAGDNASIITDVLNFSYDPAALRLMITNGLKISAPDISATPGNGTVNASGGRISIPVGGNTVVINNTLAASLDLVFCQMQTLDATLTRVVGFAGNGIITISGNANATGTVLVEFLLIKKA